MRNEKPRKLAIETMRRLAIAGAVHLGDTVMMNRLIESSFGTNYSSHVEIRRRIIETTLNYENIKTGAFASSKFFPTPFRENGRFDLILFRPHFIDFAEVVKLEIAQIGNSGRASGFYEVGYRFEKDDRRPNTRHDFPHMQITKRFNNNIVLNKMTIPDVLADVPLAEKQPHSRFFAALVAFVGLDPQATKGLAGYLERLGNTGGSTEEFQAFLKEAKLTCKELSRAWNGRWGFSDGSPLGRFLDRVIVPCEAPYKRICSSIRL